VPVAGADLCDAESHQLSLGSSNFR
jgi:hypothetical protein